MDGLHLWRRICCLQAVSPYLFRRLRSNPHRQHVIIPNTINRKILCTYGYLIFQELCSRLEKVFNKHKMNSWCKHTNDSKKKSFTGYKVYFTNNTYFSEVYVGSFKELIVTAPKSMLAWLSVINPLSERERDANPEIPVSVFAKFT